MLQNKLIPGQALIYERVDDCVYARYRDPPHNKKPRWLIGGKPKQDYSSYEEWKNLCRVAENNTNIKTQLDKLLNIYYLVKDDYSNE